MLKGRAARFQCVIFFFRVSTRFCLGVLSVVGGEILSAKTCANSFVVVVFHFCKRLLYRGLILFLLKRLLAA